MGRWGALPAGNHAPMRRNTTLKRREVAGASRTGLISGSLMGSQGHGRNAKGRGQMDQQDET